MQRFIRLKGYVSGLRNLRSGKYIRSERSFGSAKMSEKMEKIGIL